MSEPEPLEPTRTVQMYLEAHQDELADWTLKSHKYRLRTFIEWYEESSVNDLTELDDRDLYRFRVWKRKGNFDVEDGETPEEIAPVALKSQLATLWALLRFAANIHTVPEDFYERVPLPKLSGTDNVNDSTLEPDWATDILEYLHRYHYASWRHVEFVLLWKTGARMGAIRGLDLHDLDLNGQTPIVRYKHRPDQGTPTRNGEKGERFNSVFDWAGTMLQAYIGGPRVDKADEFGRKPLPMTSHGRVSASTIRQDVYMVICPCWPSRGCSYNRDIGTYETVELNHVGTCSSSRSPRNVRKGVVILHRREEVPRRVMFDRLDASNLVLDKRYNRRGKRERAEQQRNHPPW